MNANISDAGRAPAVPLLNGSGKPPSQKPKAPAQAGSAAWLIAGLLVLGAIPLISGAFVLTQLYAGAYSSPEKPCVCPTPAIMFPGDQKLRPAKSLERQSPFLTLVPDRG